MWTRVRAALKGWDPIRIENRCELGTPDVNIAAGDWIELKWVRNAPKRGDSICSVEHYSTEQRTWAIRRVHAGGRCWVLLKVSNEWLLFKGEIAAEYLGYSTLHKLREVAEKTWKITLNDKELREILKRS